MKIVNCTIKDIDFKLYCDKNGLENNNINTNDKINKKNTNNDNNIIANSDNSTYNT